MSPKTGRPPKDVTKNVSIGLRIKQDTARKLQWCADKLKISRTEVIERGIDKVEEEINQK